MKSGARPRNFSLFYDRRFIFLFLKPDTVHHVCKEGYYIYAEGTEYGGIVDEIKVNTTNRTLAYCGRTWHGILASKVLEPDPGNDYLIVSGEANTVLRQLITRMGLSDLFISSQESSGIQVKNYRMHRYIDGYTGIQKCCQPSMQS